MIKKVTIGVLLPSSSILSMGKDFERGIKLALKENISEHECEIEVVSEFIGQGNRVVVEEAINKLFGYHQVDIITGIVSNMVAMEVAEKFAKSEKPFLVNNIGEHVPNPKMYNPYIFINSNHIWQQVWSLGNWAVKQFGKRGMFVGSIYDAGYSFISMLKLGMEAADPLSEMPFAIAQIPSDQKTADPKSIFKHIDELKPDFILSVFCGEEASVFQAEYINLGLNKSTPLLALPYLLQSFETKANKLEVYTTMVSNHENPTEKVEINDLNSDNPYRALGTESGLLIAQAIKEMKNNNLTEALRQVKVKTDRGFLNINSSEPGIDDKIFLVKNTHSGDKTKITSELIEELPSIKINHQTILDLLNQPSSGWGNPYLGV